MHEKVDKISTGYSSFWSSIRFLFYSFNFISCLVIIIWERKKERKRERERERETTDQLRVDIYGVHLMALLVSGERK